MLLAAGGAGGKRWVEVDRVGTWHCFIFFLSAKKVEHSGKASQIYDQRAQRVMAGRSGGRKCRGEELDSPLLGSHEGHRSHDAEKERETQSQNGITHNRIIGRAQSCAAGDARAAVR